MLTPQPTPPDLSSRLLRQRRRVVEAFLWVLLGVVALSLAVMAALLGREALTAQVLVPHVALLGLVVVGLVLNDRHRYEVAVWLLVCVLLLGATLGVFVSQVSGDAGPLLLYFVPLVLAALLLGRRALLVTGAVTLASVAAAALLAARPPLGGGDEPAWMAALQFGIVYVVVAFFLDRFGLVFLDTLRTSVYQEARLNEEATLKLRAHQALREGERFNDVLVENLPGIFFMLDRSGSFFRVNRYVTENLGYSASELQRLGPEALVRPTERALVKERLAEVFEKGHVAQQLTIVDKDGRQIPYFVRSTRVTLGGTDYVAGIGIDRSEIDEVQSRVQLLNVELRERLERITALRDIDRAMAGNMDLGATLNVVLQQVMQRLQVDAVSILLYRADSQTLRYGASRGFEGAALRRTDLRLGEGLAGRAALLREPLTLEGRAAFRDAFAGASSLQHEEFESYMAVPLVSKSQLQGVLELFNRRPFEPDEDWSDFLVALATQAALAIDTARLFDDLERSNHELRLAYETTIEGWARALDLKDEATEGHSRRVTDLTVRLARRLGMCEDELVHVRRGALLHDIGKMGIPDHILRKPGPLTEGEWEVMKQHTTFAHDLLAPIPFLRSALEIPYCHHERFDGSGYPLGLEGEQIPLSARLFAVVDVYDALTSERPYREAWGPQRALGYIAAQAGRHFDPAVAAEFMELMQGSRERAATG